MFDDAHDAPAKAWVERFQTLLEQTMPYMRRAAPELSEEELLIHASYLVEVRLGGIASVPAASVFAHE